MYFGTAPDFWQAVGKFSHKKKRDIPRCNQEYLAPWLKNRPAPDYGWLKYASRAARQTGINW